MLHRYEESQKESWDAFVLNDSINGNFLQSRAFLSYHPEGRFQDASLLYFDPKGVLRAVIPAAEVHGDNGKGFVSHPGSTYGGIVLDKKTCSAKRLQPLIEELVLLLENEGFDYVDLRFPPDFMWRSAEAPLVEYMLGLNGFKESIELTTYVDYSAYGDPIVSNFSQGKRTNVNNGIKEGFTCRSIGGIEEAKGFYALLCDNLKKHDAKPAHTFEELWGLYSENLAGETELLGVYDGGKLIAAGWVFFFKNMETAHTQYLCADNSYSRLSPMTFLYYSVIQYCKERGFEKLSWGVSTEKRGSILNWGLTESKEHFGSLHGAHRSFSRDLQ